MLGDLTGEPSVPAEDAAEDEDPGRGEHRDGLAPAPLTTSPLTLTSSSAQALRVGSAPTV